LTAGIWSTLTLEAYSVTGRSSYPSGSTVFSQTNLELSNGQFPGIKYVGHCERCCGWDYYDGECGGINGSSDYYYVLAI
jgi:hypothetical protein